MTSERERLAEALREMTELLAVTELSENEAGSLVGRIEAELTSLRALIRRAHRASFGKKASPSDRQAFWDHSPLIGKLSPLAPPLRMEVLDRGVEGEERVEGRVRFGYAYEGPPGHVHGGYVAAIFDELLGYTQTLSGEVGLTGKLTVRFREPTPLHTDLRLVGRLKKAEGRYILTRGEVYAGEKRTADAEGLFVRLHPEHHEGLEAGRRDVAERATRD